MLLFDQVAGHFMQEGLATREHIEGQADDHAVGDGPVRNAELLVLPLNHFVSKKPVKNSKTLFRSKQRSRAAPFLRVINGVNGLEDGAGVDVIVLGEMRAMLQPALVGLGHSDQSEEDLVPVELFMVDEVVTQEGFVSHIVYFDCTDVLLLFKVKNAVQVVAIDHLQSFVVK